MNEVQNSKEEVTKIQASKHWEQGAVDQVTHFDRSITLNPRAVTCIHDRTQFFESALEQSSYRSVTFSHSFDDLGERQAFHVSQSNGFCLSFGNLV